MSTTTVDWPRLLGDIAYLLGDQLHPDSDQRQAVGTPRLAEYLGISRGALRNLLDGTEPRHSDGEAFIREWVRLTGKPAAFVPMARAVFSAAKA